MTTEGKDFKDCKDLNHCACCVFFGLADLASACDRSATFSIRRPDQVFEVSQASGGTAITFD